jgi:peptide/nickel transport system ATP-binding protein
MRQRSMIAMAMANNPRVLIADEPTTALDVTIQAQVVQLLRGIRDRTGTAIVLITHDLGLIAEIADRVVVMYGGRVVEEGTVSRIFAEPSHPYTVGLLRSMPRLEQAPEELPSIPGHPPDPAHLPQGCAFHPRCPLAMGRKECQSVTPPLAALPAGGASACHFRSEVPAAAATLFEGAAGEQVPLPGAKAGPAAAASGAPEPILQASQVVKTFVRSSGLILRTRETTHALSEVDLTLHAGRTLALVGESGSGKSTLARVLLGLLKPTAGTIRVRGAELTALSVTELRDQRRHIQIVFQDPYASLNPVRSVGEIIADPLRVHRYEGDIDARVDELLGLVGLDPAVRERYPHAFSGGQRQRICIARALALDPDIVVLDEPVSALDVSVQAQILNLLNRLRRHLGVSYLLISHDLAVVRQFAVMYMGRIVERGPAGEIYRAPAHHYTRALLDAVPIPDPRGRENRERRVLGGDMPSPNNPPSGCRFRTRCPRAEAICAERTPPLSAIAGQHLAACHFPLLG